MPARRKPIHQKVDHRERDRPLDQGGEVIHLPTRGVVKVPPARRHWHRVAKDWYKSLNQSGQVGAYEPSDWAAAQLVAEQMSRLLKDAEESGQPIRAAHFETVWNAMGDLLTTETARRKARVELKRDGQVVDPEQAEVDSMVADYVNMFKDDDSS
ncbi:hypothetical protein [Corynebacterium halotolerans]|uniref:phage terminase small subunit n=1 Tax=Corynebacterium halotolerans TaxID=225326 RepID=UPI003CE9D876